MRAAALVPVLLLTAQAAAAQQPAQDAAAGALKQNWFDDPFFQVSSGLAACAVPEGPFYTAEERRIQTHSRLERGTSCWLAGKCTDSNAYRYDKPLAPKVRAALLAVPGVRSGSVWVMVQRRWVYLQGCVPSAALAKRLERAARAVPDVETVVPDLMIGTRGKPPYPVAAK
ncbi:BON domain-containing protein [Variovorax boronicumulans]|uniref:BON domain-containing protein n=1 Tax=Variovorax boronicumulans TaxID=436515 RepID=UPI0027D86D44|nr:BON domain-containing protein [Variovorax boronicumulans]